MLLRLIRLLLIAGSLSFLSFTILRHLNIKLSDRATNILAFSIGIITFIIQKLFKF